jgi:Flp pilus assembly protein TadD
MRSTITLVAALLVLLTALHMEAALSQELGEADCGSLDNAIGPWNYYSKEAEAVRFLLNVESNHFNETVRSLRGGQTAVGPMSDLDYVLRAFPNHPEALMLVARYQAEGGSRGQFRSATCYFDRARRFVPDDPAMRMLFAIHLTRNKEDQRALDEYEAALAIAPDYTEAHYNIGLLLVKMGRLEEAKVHAEKAYDGGYPLEGLRRQLVRRGAWNSSP